METKIAIVASDREISDCFPVMKELRTHLELPDFIDRVRRQQQQFNYQLVYLQVDDSPQGRLCQRVRAVAGFRISENLAWGKYLYVDDLVSSSEHRSQGYGSQLFNWLVDYACSQDCQQLTLDSGVQRFAAHRFYLHQRMDITSHHFTLLLT